MNRKEVFETRLRKIDWASYEIAYGPAINVASDLLTLGFGEEQAALAVSYDLWCGLCHQHAYISSAALPALPFLLEILESANDALALEIMDMLLGFVRCTHPHSGSDNLPWEKELRKLLTEAQGQLEKFRTSDNAELEDMTREVLEDLRNFTVSPEQFRGRDDDD